MNIVERAKNIIVKPKDEWNVIATENTPPTQLVVSYLLILALIPAAAQFIRYGLIGFNIPLVGHVSASIAAGIRYAIIGFISYFVGAYLSAFIIDILATSFGSQKNFGKAMELVVYSYTPMLIASIFQMIPGLGILAIVGFYGLYLLYIGFKPMMFTPDDKITGYFVVSLVVIIVVYFVLSLILTSLFITSALTGAAIGM
ncbi:MAG TPA: Yip1 family protein [Bacteroidales bacterium]|nr:Yip1 family protein [Bacteroidales bacterium]